MAQLELSDLLSTDLLQWVQDDTAASANFFEDYNELLLAASNSFEDSCVLPIPLPNPTLPLVTGCPTLYPGCPTPVSHVELESSTPATRSSGRIFAAPKTEEEIRKARSDGVPKKTQQDTDYCVKLWREWQQYRLSATGVTIPPLEVQSPYELQKWLTPFILEVRKKDGSEFTPNTLHHICCGIMRYMRWNGHPDIDIFKDAAFADFRASLDSEMKRLQSAGIGSKRKQAEPLTAEEEELLWQKGLLGDANPQTLLNTIVFMAGYYFALRSGNEHRQLRSKPCQIELIELPGERAYLQYIEDTSKNRPGGLKGRKMKPKIVKHHANETNPERCFVRLFKLYLQLRPKDCPDGVFYLQPLRKPSQKCWYSARPLGHHTLDKTVARLCKAAGIGGFRTNHSLRATAATRLYQSGIDEQLVMERTGHRSLEGVRSYKRTSEEQCEAVSDILNSTKKIHIDGELEKALTVSEQQIVTSAPQSQGIQLQALQNTLKQTVPAAFCFNSCNSVTVNLHCSN